MTTMVSIGNDVASHNTIFVSGGSAGEYIHVINPGEKITICVYAGSNPISISEGSDALPKQCKNECPNCDCEK